MNKRLPLDDFENNIQELADGFEIKPRSIVFENIRYELSAESSLSASKSGRIIRTIFSKGLTFAGYAAAASVLTVSTVFFPQSNKISEEENIKQYHKNRIATTERIPAEINQDSAVYREVIDAKVTVQEIIDTSRQNLAGKFRAMATPATTLNSAALNGNSINENPVHKIRHSTGKQHSITVLPFSPFVNIKTETRKEHEEVAGRVNETSTSTVSPSVLPVLEKIPASVEEEIMPAFNFPDSDGVTLRDTLIRGVKNVKTGAWSVAVFYSYDQISNTYKSDKMLFLPTNDTYQAFRDRTQQTSYGYRTGFKVDYSLLNQLSIGSGINFSKVTDKISAEANFERIYDITRNIWVDDYYTNPGYEKVITNSYQYIEIPLTVSYSSTLYKQIACRVTTGAGFGYLFGTSSYYLIDKFDDPFKVYYAKATGVSGSTPFTHSMINFNLSAYVSYLASKRIEVYAGPNLRKSVSSIYKKGYSATQKFTTLGSEIGVRFFF
jgi:hypothetical protein